MPAGKLSSIFTLMVPLLEQMSNIAPGKTLNLTNPTPGNSTLYVVAVAELFETPMTCPAPMINCPMFSMAMPFVMMNEWNRDSKRSGMAFPVSPSGGLTSAIVCPVGVRAGRASFWS